MNNLIVAAIVLVIAAWFIYCLYRWLRGASGRDCATCALGGDFDYKGFAHLEPKKMKPKEIVMKDGGHVIVDEAAARARRERVRKMMEQGKQG